MRIRNILFFLFIVFIKTTLVSQSPYFKEVSDSVGLDYLYPGNEFQMAGGGLMIIDVNNDGWEDVFQSGGVFDSKLWINNKGKFEDKTSEYGLDLIQNYFIQGAFCADYDNDGFQDFVIANYGSGMGRGDKKTPALLRNIDGKRFELIDLSYCLPTGNYASACWGDINHDGYVDLYLTNYVSSMSGVIDSSGREIGYDPRCFANKLLINQSGKSFIEMAESYGVSDPGCGLAASFTDVDLDGNPDLLLLNDFGQWTKQGNKFFRNNYPITNFTDLSDQYGFASKMYGMGIGQGDYDGDGDPDYYITNIGQNSLYRNDGTTFHDVAMDLGIDISFVYDSVRGTSWSGLFFDADFDGDLDLYVSKGNVLTLVPKTVIKDKNRFFLNENGQFNNHSFEAGLDDLLSHRGAVITDFDRDGDLDIISAVVKMPWAAFAGMEQKIKLYRNDLLQGNCIGIRLKGNPPIINEDCFGCHIIFHQEDKKMFREVDGASGQASQSGRIIWYGLGSAEVLDAVDIVFSKHVSFRLNDLNAGFIYTVSTDGTISQETLSK